MEQTEIVRNKILIHPAAAILILVLVSCSDANKGNLDKQLTASEEKKEIKLIKSKKREKKKSISLVKKKAEPSKTNIPAKETEITPIAETAPAIIHLAHKIKEYAILNGYSTKFCFLVDMSLPSGRDRFFIYDLEKGSVVSAALAAHGSCNTTFLSHPRFSNARDCGCTSLGKYKVGEFYNGQYGKSFRLYGLDKSNSNAFKRGVVIHGHDCVPNEEIYPRVLCNSFGCVMVSNNFFDRLSAIIQHSDKQIVLWVYG